MQNKMKMVIVSNNMTHIYQPFILSPLYTTQTKPWLDFSMQIELPRVHPGKIEPSFWGEFVPGRTKVSAV